MNNGDRPHLKLVHSRPTAWIADATLDDTRAFVERYRRAWLAPAIPIGVWFTAPERYTLVGEPGDDAA